MSKRMSKRRSHAQQRADNKRIQGQIRKRQENGETPKTSRALARLFDRLYGTDMERRYHGAN